jgi:hypothetical protein
MVPVTIDADTGFETRIIKKPKPSKLMTPIRDKIFTTKALVFQRKSKSCAKRSNCHQAVVFIIVTEMRGKTYIETPTSHTLTWALKTS